MQCPKCQSSLTPYQLGTHQELQSSMLGPLVSQPSMQLVQRG